MPAPAEQTARRNMETACIGTPGRQKERKNMEKKFSRFLVFGSLCALAGAAVYCALKRGAVQDEPIYSSVRDFPEEAQTACEQEEQTAQEQA